MNRLAYVDAVVAYLDGQRELTDHVASVCDDNGAEGDAASSNVEQQLGEAFVAVVGLRAPTRVLHEVELLNPGALSLGFDSIFELKLPNRIC